MTPQENFRLNVRYTLTEEDKIRIARYSSNPLNKDDWKNDGLLPFKKSVRKFLAPKQQKLCAFCRTPLDEGSYYLEVEHIVPKALHTKWMFDPQNFCLSCRRCNAPKYDKETLMDPNSTDYPQDGSGFCIINPYHDTYSDHIELIEGLFYSSKTAKGRNTIELCNLTRYELVLKRIELRNGYESRDSYVQLLTTLLPYSVYVDDMNALLAKIEDDIADFKFNG